MTPSPLQCDVLIIGAGIAGVSIAELVSREARRRNKGIKVLVVDRASELDSGASSGLQGWFHTGALYTRLDSDESYLNCVKSHEVLKREYANASDFAHHSNCNIHALYECDHAWLGDSIRFVIDHSDHPEWTKHIHQMTDRLLDLGASRNSFLQSDNGQYTTLLAPDRSLRTQAIVSDLAESAARN